MKKIITLLVFFIGLGAFAQVGIGNTNPDPSSILDLTSTTQGMLAPRMTESERDAITSPANGLLIYQTNNAYGFYYWDGSSWKSFGGGGTDNDWTIAGTDMYNANTGNIGVGNTSPSTKFHITGTTTLPSSGGSGPSTTIFTENFSSYSVNQNYVTDPDCSNSDGWESGVYSGTYFSDTVTSDVVGEYLYINSSASSACTQIATAIVGNFSPTGNEITIEFDYGYHEFAGSFSATLHNETDNAIATTLFTSTSASFTEVNFSQTATALDPTKTYSLRFNYSDSYGYGASVDNVKITETTTGSPVGGSYVFRLDDGQQAAGKVLTSDADGNATWQPAGAGSNQTLSILGNDLTISGGNTVTLPSGGGGGSYTFTNGLTESGGTVRLGGQLINATTIDMETSDLILESNASPSSGTPGEFIINGGSRSILSTYVSDDYILFGGNFPSAPTEDGDTFTDSGGRSYRKDFVAGFQSNDTFGSGTSGGSAIQVGSIEHIMDGQAEVFINNDFNPLTNGGADLGSASKRWGTVYASNGTINTSDINLKTNIKKLDYGLSEIMKLETITYNWKDSKTDNAKAKAKISQKETKIGFIAQNLLEVLPETVNTHSMVAKDEKGNYERVKNKYLGVYYSDIIPVAVKAIQEQQEIIEAQNKKIESLEAEIFKIESLKSQISNLEETVNKLISSEK
jgi:hypothetical protein